MFKISREEIIVYLKKIPFFPSYKIKEFSYVNHNLKAYYKPINSKEQINSIMQIIKTYSATFNRYSALSLETDLIQILSKFMDIDFTDKIREIIKTNKDDDTIYNLLRDLKDKHKSKQSLMHPKFLPNAAEIVAQNFRFHLHRYIQPQYNYLDLGAGNGYKTKLIAKYLSLNLNNVHCIDFKEFDQKIYDREKELKFKDLDNHMCELPYEDNSFDFVSSLMVLHHITDDKVLEFTLNQIKRILKHGGYFLIKEHNAMSASDKMLADIEHCMYEIVYNKVPNYKFRKAKYSRYFSWIEWDIILKRFGFTKVEMHGMDYSINNQINASKHYFALYILKK